MNNELKFNNGKFRIMLVGDPHESPNDETQKDKDIIQDYLSLQYAAVKQLNPDLVILMGDNATGENENLLRKTLLRITKPYVESNIPFAFVLGNHDLECNVNDIKTQYEIYRRLPCCILPEEDKINSFGDYNLTIRSTESDKDIFNIWFMYSGSGAAPEYYSYYDFVKKEQIEWYEKKSDELKSFNGRSIPSMVIQHIPVPEEFRLLNEQSCLCMLSDGVTGQNEQKGKFYTLNKMITTGYMGEAPCTSAYNSGQFDSWKKKGDVVAAFFGHDHMNDFVGVVDGIMLGQCKTAGFRPYGDGLMQGVRIIDINENTPDSINTKMYYYRELVGDDCLSISGAEKILRDRTSVKIDVAKKIMKFALPVVTPVIVYSIYKKFKKK